MYALGSLRTPSEGLSNAEIARRVGCDVKTARKWRGRFAATRADVEALVDELPVAAGRHGFRSRFTTS